MGIARVILIIAITMALSITLSLKRISDVEEKPRFPQSDASYADLKELSSKENKIPLPSKRLNRFLAERNENAADHCHKDNEVCTAIAGRNSTCCNNKCTNLAFDSHNCGSCKKKCKFTETCCRGQCVNLVYDKRHCGRCNHRCNPGEFCVYAMCNYA